MTDFEQRIGEEAADVAPGWTATWLDRQAGILRLTDGRRVELAVVEGDGSDWHVVLRGRRIPVAVRTWRERVLAEAESASRQHGVTVEVRAMLPGLVVEVHAEAGREVAEGEPLLTIEAMKMQNEVRAPRAGVVVEVLAAAGQPVATGALLMRLA